MMPRRILFASWYIGLGGGETDLLTLAESLDPALYDPHLLLPREGQLADHWRNKGWRVHIVPYRGATTFFVPQIWERFPVVQHLADLLQREHIDLVHSDYHTLPMIAPASYRADVPCMWTVHGWWFKPKRWQRAFFREIERAVARSNAVRDGFLGDPPFMPSERLPVVYSGIDTERFSPDADRARLRIELGLSSDVPIVAMVARFQKVKGHHIFQQMAEEIAKQEPTTQFVVAGEDVFGVAADQQYRDEMLANAKHNPLLRERLHYIGFRDDVEHVYAAADMVVCASDFESYGKANLEAMACGTPVVSTRRGGPSETVIDGETGYLVDAGDATGLARCVLTLLRDATLRQTIGNAGRRHVLERFSASATATAYMTQFDALLAET
jgi:glycosyltransferase involved in cell wall biosynthesis